MQKFCQGKTKVKAETLAPRGFQPLFGPGGKTRINNLFTTALPVRLFGELFSASFPFIFGFSLVAHCISEGSVAPRTGLASGGKPPEGVSSPFIALCARNARDKRFG